MIKFIHTADFHFGIENYGKIDLKTGIHSRLLDFDRALNFCVDKALENHVDFFLFSGDAYKTTNPTPTQQKLLFQSFLRLYNANIPIVIIIGNHDNPLSFGKTNSLDVFDNLPLDGFHVISKPKIVKLKTKNGPVQIVGIPWPTKNNILITDQNIFSNTNEIAKYISQSVGKIIESLANQLDQDIPSILAGHLTVSSGIFSGSEKSAIYGNDPVFLPSQLAIKPFDYIALGHLHRHQNLNPNGYPAIVYSGSIERVDFGERNEEKGFCLVKIINKNKTTYEFIQIPTRSFIQIEIVIKPLKDQTTQIIEELQKYNLKDAIVKIVYHLPDEENDKVNFQAIHKLYTEAMYMVGAIPIRKEKTRVKRSDLNFDMDFRTLLDVYFDSKPELQDKKNELIKKTLFLYEETKFIQQEE